MDWQPDIPRWRQVYAVMEERIAEGTYPPGGRLPSVVDVCAEFEISQMTARKLLQKLRDAGLAASHPGVGPLVTELPQPPKA